MLDACTRRIHIAESSKTCNTIIGLKNADGDGDDDVCIAGTNSTSEDGHANRPPASPYPSPLNTQRARPDDAPPLLDKPSTFPAHVSTALDKRLQFDLNEGARNARNEKRTTLTWSDLSTSGFTRTDTSAPPSNSPPPS
ncbi:hypothetical protein M422DRAFT_257684 [Sphaerobolus stellatus SS14]|uniref:Uncharacterized protein n=1 Tax=Sphaerobolus stellatus (strain SS14) TaxID=990650 RepID=A0A0C9VP60_SPHS4|nr:hypothetical protein M422DRAFT_257684 [Sphaerobolus stellatus SS14]